MTIEVSTQGITETFIKLNIMDEKAVLVTIDAGKSLFGIIVINRQLRFIAANELVNSYSYNRYNDKILDIADGPIKENFFAVNEEIVKNEKKNA